MKANMLISPPLCLLLCWMLSVDSMTIHFNLKPQDATKVIPLSMVADSVDDMCLGCNAAMMKTIKDRYLEKEKREFAPAWKRAKDCAENKFKARIDKALTKEHMQAICLYTAPGLFKKFNEAVRTNGSFYISSFQYHSLYYLLNSAIQILADNDSCHTTYRRAMDVFTGKVDQIIRFGSFTSSSFKTDLKIFGRETCFKIKTCSGAFLKNYSFYDDREEEVLIPPYEMFKIAEKIKGQVKIKGLEDCKVVFVLESAGVESNLNCKVVHQVQKFFSNMREKTFFHL